MSILTERQRDKMRFNIGILFIAAVLLLGTSADDDSDDDGLPDDVDIDDDNDGIVDAGKDYDNCLDRM